MATSPWGEAVATGDGEGAGAKRASATGVAAAPGARMGNGLTGGGVSDAANSSDDLERITEVDPSAVRVPASPRPRVPASSVPLGEIAPLGAGSCPATCPAGMVGLSIEPCRAAGLPTLSLCQGMEGASDAGCQPGWACGVVTERGMSGLAPSSSRSWDVRRFHRCHGNRFQILVSRVVRSAERLRKTQQRESRELAEDLGGW